VLGNRHLQPENTTLNRRDLLQVGGLGLMGLTLPQLLESQAKSQQADLKPSADACIIIFLNGGPSHLDMWDMKPETAAGIRGEFNPIASSVPGYQVCEHLPRLSQHVHRGTIVRSMHHGVNNAHAAAVYASMTGHDRGEIGGGTRQTDYPSPGAVISKLQPNTKKVVQNVHLPYMTKEGAKGPPQPGFFGGILGRGYDPLFVLKDPNAADFGVPELTLQTGVSAERLSVRKKLFAELDQRVKLQGSSAVETGMNGFQHRAFDLLTSEATQNAFQISQEPDKVRDSYGRNIYGQSVLLARRLVEAGTRMVTISWAPDANATWDTHGSNFQKLKGSLLPQFDSACASLISDLVERGLFERTMVAVLGDFGRTPKINANNAGRDHWNYCYSLALFGGGFQQGLVYGTSDKTGAFPATNPLKPGDIVSSMYHNLGIQNNSLIYDPLSRPYRLVPEGDVISELLT